MSWNFTEGCALVTGASSGIGAATAERLARLGTRVVLVARRREALERVAARIRKAGGVCLVVVADVSKPSDNQAMVDAAVNAFGRIDVLLLNAGRGQAQSVEHTSESQLLELFQLNVFSLYYGVQAALPVMRGLTSGRIVIVGSLASRLAMPFGSVYAACKHAALGFSNSLRLELADTGLTVSVVCPGNVATPWADSTTGLSMLNLVRAALPDAMRLAEQNGQTLINREVLAPRAIADAIIECIENPVAEVYPHPGSHAQVVEAVADPRAAERAALPLALAMGRSYPSLVAVSAQEATP